MRISITIDDELMEDALQATGLENKSQAIELALRTLLQLRKQEEIRQYFGKIHVESLQEMGLDARDGR